MREPTLDKFSDVERFRAITDFSGLLDIIQIMFFLLLENPYMRGRKYV